MSKEGPAAVREIKPFVFDKAKYRQKKYSHAHKLGDWKKNHKLDRERKYKKLLRKDEKKKQFQNKTNANLEPLGAKPAPAPPPEKKHMSGLDKAKKAFNDKATAKIKQEEEMKRKQTEKDAAVKKYKEQKSRKSAALRAKTKRGQPVMAGRMELLLEKIQKQCQEG